MLNLYINNNYLALKNHFDHTKPYQKKDFVKNVSVPQESDIVESAINAIDYPIDANHVYTSIGKLFENANMYDRARMFFTKNYETLIQKSAPQNALNDAVLDIERVDKKTFDITA